MEVVDSILHMFQITVVIFQYLFNELGDGTSRNHNKWYSGRDDFVKESGSWVGRGNVEYLRGSNFLLEVQVF